MSKVPIKIECIEIYYDAFGKCTPEWLEQAPTSCNLQWEDNFVGQSISSPFFI